MHASAEREEIVHDIEVEEARTPAEQEDPPLAARSKQLARPTTPNPDPVGFAQVLNETSAQLEEAYQTRLRAFLRKFDLVRFEPAVRRSIFAAVTARRRSVSVDFRITFYPPIASGLFRAGGELITPVAELATETERDEQSDDPEYGPQFTGLFGEPVGMRRPKGGWDRRGRRR